MLDLIKIDVTYSKSAALRDVTIRVAENEVVALLGANGAGKSTTLRTISGLKSPDSGDIIFCGESIRGLQPDSRI
jgi:branched-chain amino acid transport system ATP-binding protein